MLDFSNTGAADHIVCMRQAIDQAIIGARLGEVPIGAVVAIGGEIIARAHNEIELRQDATAHAEVLAMQRASAVLQNWRLSSKSLTKEKRLEIVLYVTLEPCTMCVGAMILARLDTLVYGAVDVRQGAAGSVFDLTAHSELPHSVKTIGGILSTECSDLLTNFFSKKRRKPSA